MLAKRAMNVAGHDLLTSLLREPAPGSARDQPRMFTARATTITARARLIADWTSISIFAQRLRGIASVGLNAVAFVKET